MAQEQSSNADHVVHAARIAVNLGTGNFGNAMITAVSDPGQTLSTIKYVLAVIVFIIMVPVLIAASIPTSILSLVSFNTSTSSSISETEAISNQYDSFYNAFEEVLRDSAGEATGKVKVNMCLLISYFSAYCEKQTQQIESKDQIKVFKEKIKAAKLITIKKNKNSTTISYKGDKAFGKFLNLTQQEMETCQAKSSVLATIINKKEMVSFDLSGIDDAEEYLDTGYSNGKKYNLSKSDYELLCKIIAQECSVSYDGSLAVISQMCNMCEYGQYKGKSLMYTATHGWYESYTSGAYRNRHPASFVKKAVTEALNGKRNLPPYVQDFWQTGYKPKNYGYDQGNRFYKTIGDNDYFYKIQDKQKLKKVTAAYEKASSTGSLGPVVYYNQAEYHHTFSGPGGTNTLKSAGCGATSMAICISTLTGRKVTPIQTSDWGAKHGLYQQGSGWVHSCPYTFAEHWGLKCKGLGSSKKALRSSLEKGHLVVALMKHGIFTSGNGHYIVLYGLDKNGKILVSDCGKRARCGAWDFDTVYNSAKLGMDSNGPFWQIYK